MTKQLKNLIFVAILFVATILSTYAQKNVIAYLPSYYGDIESVSYDKLTHIMYSGLQQPLANGNLAKWIGRDALEIPSEMKRLDRTVTLAHQNNVKVLMMIGGWTGNDNRGFEAMAASEVSRRNFVNNCAKMVTDHNLDGIDIDWEYPNINNASAENYATMMILLGEKMHSMGKILTTAVMSSYRTGNLPQGYPNRMFKAVDFWNIMAYDNYRPNGENHSTWENAVADIKYWLGRGVPKEKIILGLPFYGYKGGTSMVHYGKIIETHPNLASHINSIDGIEFNGIDLIKRKTQYAIDNTAGVMFWEIFNDTPIKEKSLLNAIHEVMGTRLSTDTENKFVLTDNTMHPNPSTGSFNLNYSSLYIGEVSLKIFTIGGREVKEIKFQKSETNLIKEINLENQTSGIYIVKIKAGEDQSHHKIIKN